MRKFWYLTNKRMQMQQEWTGRAAKELQVEIEVKYLNYSMDPEENGREIFGLLAQAGEQAVDAIICRGSTALFLQSKKVSQTVPVIPVQFSGASTISLLAYVKEHHPEHFDHGLVKVVVFSHRAVILDEPTIRLLFQVEVENVILEQLDEAYICERVAEAKRAGVEFMIAGPRLCSLAERLGVDAYFNADVNEYESVFQTVRQAITLVDNIETQKERNHSLESIMSYSFEGIVQLDREGRVLFCNSVSEQIMQVGKGQALGQYIWKLIPELERDAVESVLEGGENIYGAVIKGRKSAALVNVTPYTRGGIFDGAIVHLNKKEQMENLEVQIKSELYSKGLVAKYHFNDIIGESEEIRECKYRAKQFAEHHGNILLLGESGTGKELFAQSIHNHSIRSNQPFVAINCGALPMNLLESELFGYVGGAFTGASRQGKKGLIELADKGTIFLDEISEMDLQGQVRLLRVLEERVITKVGDNRVIPVDVRIVAASNKNLKKLVAEGKFREDLYYRLNVLTLQIPPLRARGEDALLLSQYFFTVFGKKNAKEVRLTKEAEQILRSYSWTGNVRQLRNFCERLVVISNTKLIEREMLERQLREVYQEDDSEFIEVKPFEKQSMQQYEYGVIRKPERDPKQLLSSEEVQEREQIIQVLNRCNGKREAAAREFGISRSSLWRRMKKYGIEETY